MNGDIALILTDDNLGDLLLTDCDIDTDAGLQTAVLISLFTDRRVSADEELPAGETSRRGWWGDTNPAVPNDRIGSRLWLLYREKQLSEVVERANEYAREAVQWLIDDKVATRVEVLAESTKFQQLDIQITIYRPNRDEVKFKYNYNWQAQAANIA